jgi:CRISPR/Cas system CSM-associated protein Csm5 (group 7 of RAMP superfamily)
MKTQITLRALEQRIRRRLAKKNQSLQKTRIRKRTIESLGPYYIVNDITNSIAVQMIDPVRLVEIGKEMGVLANWEEVKI